MTQQIQYITFDGRDEDQGFHKRVVDTLENLKPGQGIHIIKEFEPFPLYDLMARHGLDRKVEQKGDEEFHAWFFPKLPAGEDEMGRVLGLD
jgi:hypothetical protein